MELGIGTVQFGLDYGISNTQGRCSPAEVGKILGRAESLGITLLDTAAAYGVSERILGETLNGDSSFRVVTKLGPFEKDMTANAAKAKFDELYRESLTRLGEAEIFGLLLHHFEDVVGAQGDVFLDAMQELKKQGEVKKIGISVYSGDQIDKILDIPEIGLVQLPLNIFDQRLIANGHLESLRERNIEIHARSVFLQGLLLMNPMTVPAFFNPIQDKLLAFHEAAKLGGVSPLAAALAYVKGTEAVDCAVVGVNSEEELIEIAEAWNSVDSLVLESDEMAVSDPRFLNPANWPADLHSTDHQKSPRLSRQTPS